MTENPGKLTWLITPAVIRILGASDRKIIRSCLRPLPFSPPPHIYRFCLRLLGTDLFLPQKLCPYEISKSPATRVHGFHTSLRETSGPSTLLRKWLSPVCQWSQANTSALPSDALELQTFCPMALLPFALHWRNSLSSPLHRTLKFIY